MKTPDDNDIVRAYGHADFDPLANLRPLVSEPATRTAEPTKPPSELVIGSDVEVASLVLELLRQDGQPVVFDRGAFYRYAPDCGLWQSLSRHEVERAVHTLDGMACGEHGRFKANQPRVIGTTARAAATAEHKDFFTNATSGIAFSNGFLSVSSDGATLLPHSPEHRATVGLPMAFDAFARAPRFERFLHEIFAGDADAGAKIKLLQQFVGACLVGAATRFQAALVLVGIGANGKSVLIEIVQALFPSGSVTAIPPQDLGQEYRRAMLAGARLNAVSEMPEREVIESEAFKAVITGDQVIGRHIREAPFAFKPTAGHLFAANRLPSTTDQSQGFWRRLLPVEFRRVFATDEQNTTLAATIIADELPGVAAWAIDGASTVMREGHYTIPASVVTTREAWQLSSDQVHLFAEDKLIVDSAAETSSSILYSAYADWAKNNGHRALASNKFFPRLTTLDLGIERHRHSTANYYTCQLR